MEKNLEEKQKEIILKLSFFEQQIKNLQQQLQSAHEAILDLNSLILTLDEIKKSKEKEILASLGRGIFVNAKITSEDVLVDVGDKKFVKKSVEETKELIKEQLEKLESIRENIEDNIENFENEIDNLISEAENLKE
jgi:prefoldin alpha subunit